MLHGSRPLAFSLTLLVIASFLTDIQATRYAKHRGLFVNKEGSCSGYISSPNFPAEYRSGDSGYYKIQVRPDNVVTIEVQLMEIESSWNCKNDSVEIYDGSNQYGRLLAKICGSSATGQRYTASGNSLFVVFRSNSRIEGTGFQMVYYSDGRGCVGSENAIRSSACSGGLKIMNSRSGVIHSPGYSDSGSKSTYPLNTMCGWLIDVSNSGRSISLRWDSFNVEASTSCEYDWVRLIDPARKKQAIGCGTSSPSMHHTTGPRLFLTFRSDNEAAAKGFKLTYRTRGRPQPRHAPATMPQPIPSPAPTQRRTPAPTQRRTPAPTQRRTPAPTQRRTPAPTQSPTPSTTPAPAYAPSYSGVFAITSQQQVITNQMSGTIVSPGSPRYPTNFNGYLEMRLPSSSKRYQFTARSFKVHCTGGVTIVEMSTGKKYGPYCGSYNSQFGNTGFLIVRPPVQVKFKSTATSAKGFRLKFDLID